MAMAAAVDALDAGQAHKPATALRLTDSHGRVARRSASGRRRPAGAQPGLAHKLDSLVVPAGLRRCLSAAGSPVVMRRLVTSTRLLKGAESEHLDLVSLPSVGLA